MSKALESRLRRLEQKVPPQQQRVCVVMEGEEIPAGYSHAIVTHIVDPEGPNEWQAR